jgi:hypothetical protein
MKNSNIATMLDNPIDRKRNNLRSGEKFGYRKIEIKCTQEKKRLKVRYHSGHVT